MMAEQTWLTTSAGVKMPRIIYGTAWKKERTRDLVARALRAGFRGIDTACQPKHYNEPQVGEALAAVADEGITRNEIFLQTKFTPLPGQDPATVPYDPAASLAEQVTQSFETSQRNLQTDRIDSLVLHSPLAPHALLMEAWGAMEKIHEAGGAGQLGISNCYDPRVLEILHRDARVKPAVVQNRFYADTGYDRELRHWCAEQGIIYQSFWTLTANPHLLASPSVHSLARQYGKTEPQILFRFLTQAGIAPLTGTCSETHMNEDLDIFSFELTTDEQEQMETMIYNFCR